MIGTDGIESKQEEEGCNLIGLAAGIYTYLNDTMEICPLSRCVHRSIYILHLTPVKIQVQSNLNPTRHIVV